MKPGKFHAEGAFVQPFVISGVPRRLVHHFGGFRKFALQQQPAAFRDGIGNVGRLRRVFPAHVHDAFPLENDSLLIRFADDVDALPAVSRDHHVDIRLCRIQAADASLGKKRPALLQRHRGIFEVPRPGLNPVFAHVILPFCEERFLKRPGRGQKRSGLVLCHLWFYLSIAP